MVHDIQSMGDSFKSLLGLEEKPSPPYTVDMLELLLLVCAAAADSVVVRFVPSGVP